MGRDLPSTNCCKCHSPFPTAIYRKPEFSKGSEALEDTNSSPKQCEQHCFPGNINMVYTRATRQFGRLPAGRDRAFWASGRWLPGSPGEAEATLCQPRGQCSGPRGRAGPCPNKLRSPRCSLLGPEQPRDSLTHLQVAIQNQESGIQPWHFPPQQQRGFQAPTVQEGILEQTLRLPQRLYRVNTGVTARHRCLSTDNMGRPAGPSHVLLPIAALWPRE